MNEKEFQKIITEMGGESYIVGGAVRDKIMGRTPKDVDYVITGITQEQMDQRFDKIVGADFPVYLIEINHEITEVALARRERKTGAGYHGFITETENVTIEEDLLRRDITINAIAESTTGALVDPYGGAKDIERGIIRHVSDAFEEDPLRILRVARFMVRYGFDVHPDTIKKCQDIRLDLTFISGDRVRDELFKVISDAGTDGVIRFLSFLDGIGALRFHFKELEGVVSKIRNIVKNNKDIAFPMMCLPITNEEIDSLCDRLNISNKMNKNAKLVKQYINIFRDLRYMTPEKIIDFVAMNENEIEGLLYVSEHYLGTDEDCRNKNHVIISIARKAIDAIDGKVLIRAGLRPGPGFGDELRRHRAKKFMDYLEVVYPYVAGRNNDDNSHD